LRRFLVPRFSPALGRASGKAVTSSNCELAAQSDVGSSPPSAGRPCEKRAARAETSK
jgi:hypothetical protein